MFQMRACGLISMGHTSKRSSSASVAQPISTAGNGPIGPVVVKTPLGNGGDHQVPEYRALLGGPWKVACRPALLFFVRRGLRAEGGSHCRPSR